MGGGEGGVERGCGGEGRGAKQLCKQGCCCFISSLKQRVTFFEECRFCRL